jgi:biopolymer transport protein ExbB/TolQ
MEAGMGIFSGIPQWALGVGVLLIAISVAKSLAFAISPGRAEERQRLRGRKLSLRDLSQAIDDIRGKVDGGEDLQQRLEELGDVQRRLSEVEERLDFAERLLTKQRDVERLPSEQK